ncbi:MAG: hypothetical protein ABI743_11720 [bacterium]
MSMPSPLTLADGALELAGQTAARIARGVLTLHEEQITLAPSRTSTDRQVVPVARWLEIAVEIVAVDPLAGLPLIGVPIDAVLTVGSQTVTIIEAHLTNYVLHLEPDGVRESLTIRCDRWTVEGG